MDNEIFSCPNCGTDILVEDVRAADAATCSQCGHRYRLEYDDLMENYQLQPEEPPQFPADIDTERI